MSRRTADLTLIALLGALVAPLPLRAQTVLKVGGQVPVEGLSIQERELVGLAAEFARQCQAAMERWIANKETTEEQLFARLYYPIAKTNPPKFSTDWDRLADRDIQPLAEAMLARSPAIIFAIITDRNAYIPTHNLKYSQPPTGNPAIDLVNSRQKRITNNRSGQIAARSQAPFLIQNFQRDTGEVMGDVSVPLTVHGAHWGTARLAYRPQADPPRPAAPPVK